LRVFFTSEKEKMNVLTAFFVWETKEKEKGIQQGYDVNPWITVRFGTSENHRIPFMKLCHIC